MRAIFKEAIAGYFTKSYLCSGNIRRAYTFKDRCPDNVVTRPFSFLRGHKINADLSSGISFTKPFGQEASLGRCPDDYEGNSALIIQDEKLTR
jgi:hypothetical protein